MPTDAPAVWTNPLRQLIGDAPERPIESCGICGSPIDDRHGHVVNAVERALLCVCSACQFLFSAPGAGGGRFRTVPNRYLDVTSPTLTAETWMALDIPVDLAFFFVNSKTRRVTAFYPSPAGATESELGTQAWERLSATSAALAGLEADVEALLVRRDTTGQFAAYIVPIDVCYELVGRLRRSWRGFQGGDSAWQEVTDVMSRIAARARGELR